MKKNKTIRLPKLHLACSFDEIRKAFQYILVTKDETVATNAHILVVHKTSEIFSDEFILAMPERFLVHKDQWKSFYSGALNISFENNAICVQYGIYKTYYEIKLEDDLKYPNYNAVFPKKADIVNVNKIGLSPTLISKITQAMLLSCQDNMGFKFEFYGEARSVIITSLDYENNSKGLIMPVVIPE